MVLIGGKIYMDEKEKQSENKDKGDNMLAVKKESTMINNVKYTPAKTKDVLNSIAKASEKYSKMLSMLAK